MKCSTNIPVLKHRQVLAVRFLHKKQPTLHTTWKWAIRRSACLTELYELTTITLTNM